MTTTRAMTLARDALTSARVLRGLTAMCDEAIAAIDAALSAAPADQPVAQSDARDAERYRALRDPNTQRHEDDPSVQDSSFNHYFEADLDRVADMLVLRHRFAHPPSARELLNAAAPAPAEPAREGWQWVPVEPTEAMEIAGGIALESSPAHDVIGALVDAWAAMLAAAPAKE